MEIETFHVNLSILFTDILTDEGSEISKSSSVGMISEGTTLHGKGKYHSMILFHKIEKIKKPSRWNFILNCKTFYINLIY